MSDQKGTTRQVRVGVTYGISEEMNCNNRGKKAKNCGPFGHSLDLHGVKDGKLVCSFCGATCPYKPHPIGTF